MSEAKRARFSADSEEGSIGEAPQPATSTSSVEEELSSLKALLALKDGEIKRKKEELQRKDDEIMRYKKAALEEEQVRNVQWPLLKMESFEFGVVGCVHKFGKCCHKPCMELTVDCTMTKELPENLRENWIAHVDMQFNLQLQLERPGRKDLIKTAAVTFSARQRSSKPAHYLTWNEISKKEYGFLKDGRLRLVIVVKLLHVEWNAIMNFFQQDASLADATLLVGNQRYHVNKMYLAQHSEFFKRMFSGRFDDAAKEEIPIEVEAPDDFENFLRCLYPERRKVTENDLRSFIPMADYFEVPTIMRECGKRLLKAKRIPLAERLFLANKYNLSVAQIRICEQLRKQSDIRNLMNSRLYEKYPEDLKRFILNKMANLIE